MKARAQWQYRYFNAAIAEWSEWQDCEEAAARLLAKEQGHEVRIIT